jgi:hypothetical protein
VACPNCPRRIAWYSTSVLLRQLNTFIHGDVQGHARWTKRVPLGSFAGWEWQTPVPPLHWRETPDGVLVDVECFNCGWAERDIPYPEGLERFIVAGK